MNNNNGNIKWWLRWFLALVLFVLFVLALLYQLKVYRHPEKMKQPLFNSEQEEKSTGEPN